MPSKATPSLERLVQAFRHTGRLNALEYFVMVAERLSPQAVSRIPRRRLNDLGFDWQFI